MPTLPDHTARPLQLASFVSFVFLVANLRRFFGGVRQCGKQLPQFVTSSSRENGLKMAVFAFEVTDCDLKLAPPVPK